MRENDAVHSLAWKFSIESNILSISLKSISSFIFISQTRWIRDSKIGKIRDKHASPLRGKGAYLKFMFSFDYIQPRKFEYFPQRYKPRVISVFLFFFRL